jgi:4-nitrophenyl phosphatase
MLNRSRLRAVELDMDGVLHRGAVVLPGATELSTTMVALGLRYACLTNNSSQLPAIFAGKLAASGITVPVNHIITSSTATALLLRERFPAGTRLYAIGMAGVQHSLFGDGYFLQDEDDVAAVVVGVDFELTYDKLRVATLALRAGAAFIATNADATFPAPEGLIPGAGAIVAALQAASERHPEVIGKPEPAMFQAALQLLGVSAEATLMIGDRLDTDIAGAQRVGIATAFVGSGVHSIAEAQAWPTPPDLILPDLAAVLAALRG